MISGSTQSSRFIVCHRWQALLVLWGQVMPWPHFPHPFIHQRMLWLSPHLGYCENSAMDTGRGHLCMVLTFCPLGTCIWKMDCWVMWQFYFVFFEELDFHNSCTSVIHNCSLFPHPHQHLLSLLFWAVSKWTVVRWYSSMVVCDLHFPVEHCFICLLAMLYILREIFIHVLCSIS